MDACDFTALKTCSKCGEAKSTSDFYKSKVNKGGLHRECKECTKAESMRHHAQNREKNLARMARHRLANPQDVQRRNSEYYDENKEIRKAYAAAWRVANPEVRRIQSQNRRARKINTGGVLSKGLSEKLFTLQKGKCPCCGKPLGDNFHLDHRMPLVRGGAHEDGNMQLLRKSCNLKKNAKDPIDWMQSKGYLL